MGLTKRWIHGAGIALMSLACAPASANVVAEKHSCAAIEQQVQQAGAVSVIAKKHRGTSGRAQRYTLVANSKHCGLPGEIATRWSIEAADGEVCANTRICFLEYPPGPG